MNFAITAKICTFGSNCTLTKKLCTQIMADYSISIIYDRRGVASKEKNGSVEICVYSKGKKKRYATGVNVKKNEWKNGRVVNRLDAHSLNEQIERKYREAHELMSESSGELSIINRATMTELSFCDWLDKEVAERTDITESTREHHRTMARKVRESRIFATFKDLTLPNIIRFDDAIKKTLSNPESVRNYHKRLKPYIAKALRLEYIGKNPYDGFSSPRGKPTNIRYISQEERTRIEELELDGIIALVRDMFIFSCYTGLADSDLRKIKESDIITEEGEQFIIDKRMKTGSQYKLMLLPKAKEILKKYNFNLDLATNQQCNQHLKTIQAMANIKTKLTMHVGRHTFATWALKKGVPIEIVSKMLAHADIQTTQIYAKVLQEEVTKGFELLKSKLGNS